MKTEIQLEPELTATLYTEGDTIKPYKSPLLVLTSTAGHLERWGEYGKQEVFVSGADAVDRLARLLVQAGHTGTTS